MSTLRVESRRPFETSLFSNPLLLQMPEGCSAELSTAVPGHHEPKPRPSPAPLAAHIIATHRPNPPSANRHIAHWLLLERSPPGRQRTTFVRGPPSRIGERRRSFEVPRGRQARSRDPQRTATPKTPDRCLQFMASLEDIWVWSLHRDSPWSRRAPASWVGRTCAREGDFQHLDKNNCSMDIYPKTIT